MPEHSSPRVTIVTPAFNRASFLPETIESVFAQTFTDFEYIVLDDGSTDETQEVLREWEQREPERFRWTSHPNMGQIRTVNKGFEMAQGDYLYVLNSDDYLYPECLEHLVAAFESAPDAVLAYGDWCVIDADGELIAQTANTQLTPTQIIRDVITVGAGVMYTRELVDAVGGWNPEYPVMPDFELWIKALLIGPYVHTPHLTAVWRSHPDAITVASRGRTTADQMIKLFDRFFSHPDLPEEFREIEVEAYRNLFIVCGISLTDVFVPHDGRFSIFDRYSWNQDVTAKRPKLEDEYIAWRNHATRLQELDEVRLKQLHDERAHSAQLEAIAASIQSQLDEAQRRIEQLVTSAIYSPNFPSPKLEPQRVRDWKHLLGKFQVRNTK